MIKGALKKLGELLAHKRYRNTGLIAESIQKSLSYSSFKIGVYFITMFPNFLLHYMYSFVYIKHHIKLHNLRVHVKLESFSFRLNP